MQLNYLERVYKNAANNYYQAQQTIKTVKPLKEKTATPNLQDNVYSRYTKYHRNAAPMNNRWPFQSKSYIDNLIKSIQNDM